MICKPQVILLLALATAVTSLAGPREKESPARRIGFTLTVLGDNDVITSSDLVGAPGYDGNGFWSTGIVFSQNINKWLEWESGLEYSRHEITVLPNLPPQSDADPRKERLALITIPFTLKAGFLKYFFVNGGLMLDMDVRGSSPVDDQTGIGPVLGTGVKYDFGSGISLFLNPYARIHSLLPFSGAKYHQKLLDSGIRFGITLGL